MKQELENEIENSIKILCKKINETNTEKLLAIGFVITDDVQNVVAKLLFEGDLPDNSETYQTLSPVEWASSEKEAFVALNNLLYTLKNATRENQFNYKEWVGRIFDAFMTTLTYLDLRKSFGESLYLTFAGVDPNSILEEEEKRFVRAMNSSLVFEQWCVEFD